MGGVGVVSEDSLGSVQTPHLTDIADAQYCDLLVSPLAWSPSDNANIICLSSAGQLAFRRTLALFFSENNVPVTSGNKTEKSSKTESKQ